MTANVPAWLITSRRRWVPMLGLAVATTLLLASLRTVTSAQSGTINIRPTTHDPGSTIGNPQNAYDTSDATTAGSTVTHICNSQCNAITTKTATWSGVADGYRPRRLEVHWQGAASIALFGGDTSSIEVKLEYSLNGGASWSTSFDSETTDYVWTGNSPACASSGITCTNHVSTKTLDAYQHTDQIQVRATLTVQLPHCDNCMFRVSNNAGQIWVFDIRVVVDDCRIPIAESTDSVTWEGSPNRTIHDFRQELTPPAGVFSFEDRDVIEADGDFLGDTCHFMGDGVPPVVEGVTTGGRWTVESNNTWAYDSVGWGEDAVNFYQHAAVAKPCGWSGWQQMLITCPSGNPYATEYSKNFMSYQIGDTYVKSQRQSSIQQRDWP